MICQQCADAVAKNGEIFTKAEKTGVKPEVMAGHPQNCGCPCQHKWPGSWKGVKH